MTKKFQWDAEGHVMKITLVDTDTVLVPMTEREACIIDNCLKLMMKHLTDPTISELAELNQLSVNMLTVQSILSITR